MNERFVDLFNTVIFNGKDVIKPESLQEMDTDVSGSINLKDYQETLSRTRDIIKKSAYGVEFVVVGIESQKHIHYAMPLRHMNSSWWARKPLFTGLPGTHADLLHFYCIF